MKFSILALIALATAKLNSQGQKVLEFTNFGFQGSYTPVSALNDPELDLCSCEVGAPKTFSGSNAPLNEEVSVHFRGPLILHNFAAYTSEGFTKGDDKLGDWTLVSSYDGSATKNATFLTTAGKDLKCLGKALTYAGEDGISAATKATVLKNGTSLKSNQEFVIFTGDKCGNLSTSGDCGVYREGIPAYHGFGGTVKMFLFEFETPTDSDGSADSVPNFNLPGIWLLNAQIPRTSQYQTNASYVNCLCWRSGCGEFDIFEVMNNTDSTKMLTTIHDYQNTDDIEAGRVVPGYIERQTSGKTTGGMYFDKNGNAVVFILDSVNFTDLVSAATVNKWVSDAGSVSLEDLSKAQGAGDSSTSKKSDGSFLEVSRGAMMAIFAGLVAWML